MVIDELVTKLGFQIDERGLRDAESALQGAMFKATTLGNLAANAISSAFNLTTQKIYGLGQHAIQSAAAMESLNAEFAVMMGDAQKAADFTSQIRDMAAKTPFDTAGIARNARTLMSMGVAAEKVIPTLTMLGDVAGADSGKFARLSMVFAQTQTAGRLLGQDLLQMIGMGFNPLQIISQKTGKSMTQLKKEMDKGAISAEMVAEAFKSATSEGGLFYKNTETQSQTFVGLMSTMKDAFELMMGNIGTQILPMAKQVIKGITAIAEGPLTKFGQKIADLVKPLGAIVMMLGSIGGTIFDVFMGQLIPAVGEGRTAVMRWAEDFAAWLTKNADNIRAFIVLVVQMGLFLVSAFVMAVKTGVFLVGVLGQLAPVILWVKDNSELLLAVFIGLFGAAMIMQVVAMVQTFWLLVGAISAGSVAAGTQLGIVGMLAGAYVWLTTAMTTFVAWSKINLGIQSMTAFVYNMQLHPLQSIAKLLPLITKIMLAQIPAWAGLAAVIGVAVWSYMRIMKAAKEYYAHQTREVEQTMSQVEAEALLAKAVQLKAAAKELADLESRGLGGSKEAQAIRDRIAGYQRYIDYMRNARKKAAAEQTPAIEGFNIPDFKAQLDMATKDAQILMQRGVTQNSKQTKVTNNIDIAVNADTKDGHTGLSPKGVGDAMAAAARAAFSIELQRVLTRSV